MSMCINSVFVVLAQYFKKRLSLSFGIAAAGVSMGQLVFPPLYNYLIDQYGWRGSLIIVAALTLNTLPAGALFRPLTRKRRKRTPKKRRSAKKCHDIKLEVESRQDEDADKGVKTDTFHERGVSFCNPSVFGRDNFTLYPSRPSETLVEGSIFETESGAVSMTTTDGSESVNNDEFKNDEYRYSESGISGSEGEFPVMENNYWNPFALTAIESPREDHFRHREDSDIKQLPYSASLFDRAKAHFHSFKAFVKRSARLFRSPSFVLMLLVAVGHGFGWASTTYHLVSRAESVGIQPTESSLLLTLMGAGSSLARLNIGWIVDKGFIRAEIGYFLTLGICSVVTISTPFVTEFGVLAFMAVVHGMSSGAASVTIMLLPRIVAKPAQATSVTALLLLAWGIGEISGGAMAGG